MTARIGSREFMNADLIAKLCDGDRQGTAERESRRNYADSAVLSMGRGTLWERVAEGKKR